MLQIAGFLAGESAIGSLAALNVANRETRTLTLPVLYETVVLDQDVTGSHLARLQNFAVLNSDKRAYTK
jgi:hypothetical protein